MRAALIICFLVSVFSGLQAQQDAPRWDNPRSHRWPDECRPVSIPSSMDNTIQKAWFFDTNSNHAKPLIVSLHTWSGDYNQKDPLVKEVLMRDWNYIHPNFRGANNRPAACASPLALSDIEDAIQFAVKNGKVDTSEIHIIGVSGGGHAALAAYMKLDYPVKSFHSWAPISDIQAWYWESLERGNKYANDIEAVTSGGKMFDPATAIERSPYYMEYLPEKRENSELYIYAGIHDGYKGSVPISHSIKMFNKLVGEMDSSKVHQKISDSLHLALLARRVPPQESQQLKIGDHEVHLRKKIPGLYLTIFEGGHEMIVPQALSLLPIKGHAHKQPLNILTIGDSNGALKYGWPEQLKKLLPWSTIVNHSIPGNTIGFNNLGQSRLNTLKNIDRCLDHAIKKMEPNLPDYIFICLGTNDAKKTFKNRQNQVGANMEQLIRNIKQHDDLKYNNSVKICILTPPPMDPQKINTAKYGGGNERIQRMAGTFKSLSQNYGCGFINLYEKLKNDNGFNTRDGVHLKAKSQYLIARYITNYLNQKASKRKNELKTNEK